ncbi:hypothetical protein ABBQ32_000251 [Trebouxia sp. C0010 RCD-2024]
MSVKLYQAFLSVLCTCWIPVAVTQTSASSVQALLAFKTSVQDPAGVLDSWNIDILSDPCGSANCSNSRAAQDCNWAGIACRDWDIVALAMPCTVLSDGSHTGCTLMGSPLDILTQLPSLIFLDLSGNYLQGTLPPAFATALPQLLGLFLGSNAFSGTLPAEWGRLSSLSLLNLRNNNLSGKLPPAWGAWPNMRDLRLASNQLSSSLPPEYGNWTEIEELELGDNNLYGPIPSSWADMAQLQDLQLGYNCRVCGPLPAFPMEASNTLSVDTTRTSINQNCNDNLCSDSNKGIVIRTVIGVAVIAVLILAACLRFWQLRRRWMFGYDVQSTWEFRLQQQCRRLLGMRPNVGRTHVPPRRSCVAVGAGQSSRQRRTKQAQPTLVIMPDGYSLCFAVKETPSADVAGHNSPGRHAVNTVLSVADVQSFRPSADSQVQRDVNAAGPSTDASVSSPSAGPALPAPTPAGASRH